MVIKFLGMLTNTLNKVKFLVGIRSSAKDFSDVRFEIF